MTSRAKETLWYKLSGEIVADKTISRRERKEKTKIPFSAFFLHPFFLVLSILLKRRRKVPEQNRKGHRDKNSKSQRDFLRKEKRRRRRKELKSGA